MKKAFFKAMMCAGTVSILLAGCAQESVYDPNAVTKKYEHAWEKNFGKIDPNQTWNTATNRNVTITVNEDALSNYIVQLFTAPLYDSNAKILAEHNLTTNGSGVGNVSFKVDVPQGLEKVYAMCIDSRNSLLVVPADINTNDINIVFGTIAANTKASVNTQQLPLMEAPYTENEIKDLIDNAYDLSKGLTGQYNSNINNIGELLTIPTNTQKSKSALITQDGKDLLYLELSGYIDENGSWNNSVTPGDFKLIIANNAQYTISEKYKIGKLDIIVTPGATLKFESVAQIQANTRIFIMKGGKVNITADDFNHDAAESLIYNQGEITAKKISLNSAALYNADKATIDVTEIYFNNSTEGTVLTNFGTINVENIQGNGNQGTVNNGCKLNVTGILKVNYLNQGANTSIVCKDMNFQGGVTLRENSIIRCTNLSTNLTHIQYVGEANGKALISTNNVKYANVGEGGMTMTGQGIYFEADTYDGQSDINTTEASRNYYHIWENLLKSSNNAGPTKTHKAPIEIPAGECTGNGNAIDPTPTPTPGAQSWLLACEDLGNTDDFDFNDIVFSVSHVAGTTEATVTPLAAGGTLEAHIYYGDQDLGEIHRLLGQSGYTITNTNDSKGTPGEAKKITVPENFSMADNMGGFKVVIKSNEKEMVTINAPQNGIAPQMICIDNSTNWAWPTERTNISEAYPDFGEWGTNYNTNPDWYKKSVDGKVVK